MEGDSIEEKENENILYISFNQESSCFCVGTETGFRIYNSYPLKLSCKRKMDGGIGIIEMFSRSNILALVGGGSNPNFDKNKVILYDDSKEKIVTEIIVTYNVLNVKLKRTMVFISGDNQINVFSFANNYLKIDTVYTYENKSGILGIALESNVNLICYPSAVGEVTLKNYDIKKEDKYETKTIKAHNNEIMALALNNDGSLLATASKQGTVIRIYQTKDTALIQELRRGTQYSEIFSLAFNYNSKYLACSSSQGTIHVFCVKNDENETQNQKSIIGKFVGFFGFNNQYLNSEWSFAQYHLSLKSKSVIAFKTLSFNNIIVLTYDGKYKLGVFDEKVGGEFSTSLSKNFLELEIQNDDDQ